MLFDGGNGAPLDHHLVMVAAESYCLILVLKGYNVGTENVGTRGLVF